MPTPHNDLTVKVCPTFDSAEPYRPVWDALARDNPMLGWEWLSNWWFELGAKESDVRNRLMIAVISDANGQAIGIAPFYLQSSWLGKTLRLLGDGEACSDYVRILSPPEFRGVVSRFLAQWIASPEFAREFGSLDLLVIEGFSDQEESWQVMLSEFHAAGWSLDKSRIESSWVLSLEETLDQVQRKGRDSLRRKNKGLLKLVDSSEVEIESVDDCEHFDKAWPDFVRLHQRRRQELGQPGCFASKPFERFLLNSTRQLINRGRAKIWFATSQGIRFGTMLTLLTDAKIFVYQSGMDSSIVSLDPGHICNAWLIRWAHENKLLEYDFLRGDEPYKKHLGAEPRSLFRARVVAPTWTAKTKDRLYQFAKKAKEQSSSLVNWTRQSRLSGPNSSYPPTIES